MRFWPLGVAALATIISLSTMARGRVEESAPTSRVAICVVSTNEELMIARLTAERIVHSPHGVGA